MFSREVVYEPGIRGGLRIRDWVSEFSPHFFLRDSRIAVGVLHMSGFGVKIGHRIGVYDRFGDFGGIERFQTRN